MAGRRTVQVLTGVGAIVAGLALVLAAGAVTHVATAPGPGPAEDAAIAAGTATVDMVLVLVEPKRLVGEAADGDYVTIELRGRRGVLVGAAAHEYTHSVSARVVTVGIERDGRRTYAVGIEAGPEDFPGVGRPAPTAMDAARFEQLQLGMSRSEVLDLAGFPHVPGHGQEWRGRPADCFRWRSTASGEYRLCFDQDSDPRMIGREHLPA